MKKLFLVLIGCFLAGCTRVLFVPNDIESSFSQNANIVHKKAQMDSVAYVTKEGVFYVIYHDDARVRLMELIITKEHPKCLYSDFTEADREWTKQQMAKELNKQFNYKGMNIHIELEDVIIMTITFDLDVIDFKVFKTLVRENPETADILTNFGKYMTLEEVDKLFQEADAVKLDRSSKELIY